MKPFKILLITAMTIAALCVPAFASSEERSLPEAKQFTMNSHAYSSGANTFLSGISIEGQSLEGMTLDQAKAWADSYVSDRMAKMVKLTVFTENAYLYDGSALGLTWSNPEVLDGLTAYLNDGNFVEQYRKQKNLDQNPINIDLTFTWNEQYLRQEITNLAVNFTVQPVNASLQMTESGVQPVRGIMGIAFDAESIANEVIAQINNFETTESITFDFPYVSVTPDYTYDQLAGQTYQILGSYTTDNLGIQNRRSNIALSTSRVNGTVVYPYQEASALGLYGAQTAENGYLEAPGYMDGRQVPAIGGGVCQTTTTLYNALIRAEVSITERNAHSMLVTYVPPALDAAVAEGVIDLKFQNRFEFPIYIEGYTNGDTVTFNIYGVKADPSRSVDFTWEILAVEFPNPLYNEIVDNSQVVYGSYASVGEKITAPVETHPAVEAKSYKIVYQNGVEVARTEWNHNNYRPMTGTLYVASDCRVTNSVVQSSSANAVYKYLGIDIQHVVTFKNGQPWNPATAGENYSQ